ncbi:MAG: serine hydrolase [Pirellulales bacterium]|nr:serine hydrolase [Pirellulales bacterium]
MNAVTPTLCRFALAAMVFLLFLAAVGHGAPADVDYAPVVAEVEQLVKAELDRGILTGVSVALVSDQRIVFAEGFGWADEATRRPATRQTIYRAGSISKLFTALSAMQLVERGVLELDRPVNTYCPDFRIVVPFEDADPITLRQLMCHRSGLVRESPVGGYFDPGEPSVSETVASLADCVLVHRPNTKTKYSNIGVTVVGHVVSKVSGQPFSAYARDHLLKPIGMTGSAFLADQAVREHLATSYMQVADGRGGFRRIESPVFELGTLPAGNLYTSAEDLGRFLVFLFAAGTVEGKPLIKPESLETMFTPQLVEAESGFGLGFHVGRFRDYKQVSHTGAVYGFSSSLTAVPELKVGVVVLANEDIATGPVRKLSAAALERMADARLNIAAAPEVALASAEPPEVKPYLGGYESESYWARIESHGGQLTAVVSGQRLVLTAIDADEYSADGRWATDSPVEFARDDDGRVSGFEALGQTFRRVDPQAVPPVPDAWREFLGSYGPDFIPLVVSIKHGHLYAMTENMVDYRLTPLNRTVFKMPPGMYEDEQLVFQVGPDGSVHGTVLAGMILRRTDP